MLQNRGSLSFIPRTGVSALHYSSDWLNVRGVVPITEGYLKNIFGHAWML